MKSSDAGKGHDRRPRSPLVTDEFVRDEYDRIFAKKPTPPIVEAVSGLTWHQRACWDEMLGDPQGPHGGCC